MLWRRVEHRGSSLGLHQLSRSISQLEIILQAVSSGTSNISSPRPAFSFSRSGIHSKDTAKLPIFSSFESSRWPPSSWGYCKEQLWFAIRCRLLKLGSKASSSRMGEEGKAKAAAEKSSYLLVSLSTTGENRGREELDPQESPAVGCFLSMLISNNPKCSQIQCSQLATLRINITARFPKAQYRKWLGQVLMGGLQGMGETQLIISLFVIKREEEEGGNFTRSILRDSYTEARQFVSSEVPQLPAVQSDIDQHHAAGSQSRQNQSDAFEYAAIKLEDSYFGIPQIGANEQNIPQALEGNEEQQENEDGVILKIWQKDLTPIILELIQKGATSKTNLKNRLLEWYEQKFGKLNEKTAKSLTRRFYDILKILTAVYKAKNLKNERIAPVKNVPDYQRRKLSIYRGYESNWSKQIRHKSRKLRQVRRMQDKMRKLNIRNKRARASKTIKLPFIAYQQKKQPVPPQEKLSKVVFRGVTYGDLLYYK